MSIIRAENIFSQEELSFIKNEIEKNDIEADINLGRKYMGMIHNLFSEEINNKMYAIAKEATDIPLKLEHAMVVEYSSEYGTPNLPPHFDGDTNDLIINMQLESNTSWDIGLNTETYAIKDNSAVVFNGNTEVHWRPRKSFKEGEYVRMMFVRFCKPENRSDYSYLPMNQTDNIFSDARKVRDSII